MHLVDIKLLNRQILPPNIWRPSANEVDLLGREIVGACSGLRTVGEPAIVKKFKEGVLFAYDSGCPSESIDCEISRLGQETIALFPEKSGANALIAAAFFNIRFNSIHPLKQGNGRVSRLLMSFQLMNYVEGGAQTIIDTLHKSSSHYYWIWRQPRKVRLELLVDMLRIELGFLCDTELTGNIPSNCHVFNQERFTAEYLQDYFLSRSLPVVDIFKT